MRVDIGGIGKGYAADLAADVMTQAGATAGVVAISGDIKTFGRMPDGERFVFGIQHPRQEGTLLGQLKLEDEAVSTAGDYQRYFMKDGIRYHHILDPQTLQPARASQSVTVVAKEGVIADGLDTGIFVMGPEKGMALIESLDGVEGHRRFCEKRRRRPDGKGARTRSRQPDDALVFRLRYRCRPRF